MQELERQEIARVIGTFAQRMHTVRDYLTRGNRVSFLLQKQRWFLDSVDVYRDAVGSLLRDLSAAELKSRGLLAFREYLKDYSNSDLIASCWAETQRLKADLAAVDYSIRIKGKTLTVQLRV